MSTLKFKTNINCDGCIATVTPHLNALQGIEWSVDTANKDKILTVKGDDISADAVTAKVKEAGFTIEPAKEGLFGKLFG